MTKYYVDKDGIYLGGFDGAEPPVGAIEVPLPPSDIKQLWSTSSGVWTALLPEIEDYQKAIQSLVDDVALSRRYKSGDAMATYVASTVTAWAAEAQTFVAWRDEVWQYSYAELAKVQAAEREQPTVADFISELPSITWA